MESTRPTGSLADLRPSARQTATRPARIARYLSSLRARDVIVLQAPPLLGVALAHRDPWTIPMGPLALLVLANVILMAHVFAVNDWANAAADLADTDKAGQVFTARGIGRGEMAIFTAVLLIAGVGVSAFLGPVSLMLAVAIATLSALYSLPPFDLKGRPWLSSLVHLAGGVIHFLFGYALGSAIDTRGVVLGAFCAAVFVGGHLIQELRDLSGDRRSAIRTNAVAFGATRTFFAGLACFSLSHAILLALAFSGMLPRPLAAVSVLFALHLHWSFEALRDGLTRAAVCRLQARYRGLYAVVGLVIAVTVWLT